MKVIILGLLALIGSASDACPQKRQKECKDDLEKGNLMLMKLMLFVRKQQKKKEKISKQTSTASNTLQR